MAGLILDTCVFIDVERGNVDLADYVNDDDDVALSAVTAAELLFGVNVAHTKHRSRTHRFVSDVLNTYTVIAFDAEVARTHARLKAALPKGKTIGSHDLMIAATAVHLGFEVVSTDARSFPLIPEVVLREKK